MVDFLRQLHVIERHQPFRSATGAFKATLNPQGGHLRIELKVRYVFPAGWRLFNPGMSESTFKKKLADMVSNVWGGRYRLSLHGPDTGETVRVDTSVLMIEADDPHFTINVARMGSGRSFVEQGRCMFYSGAVNYKPSALLMKIGYWMAFGDWGHDRVTYRDVEQQAKRRLERLVIFNGHEPADFTIAMDIADHMKENVAVWPLLPLRLIGYRVTGEPPDLARRRAEVFRDRLKQAGAPNSTMEIVDGGVHPGTGAAVRVEVANVLNAFLQQANHFPIAAHEVGHMLGLEDEYNPAGIADRFGRINWYARQQGIAIPPFEQNTCSLMSQGDKVLPYHYLPFLDVLETMAAVFRGQHRAGTNRDVLITLHTDLLRNADPKVLEEVELAGFFPEEA